MSNYTDATIIFQTVSTGNDKCTMWVFAGPSLEYSTSGAPGEVYLVSCILSLTDHVQRQGRKSG